MKRREAADFVTRPNDRPCPRLERGAVAAGRKPGQHRLNRPLAEPVIGDEVGVRAQPELAALARARPRPTD
jgi:hypothetical protein